jgi:hypothetical protein
MKIFWCGTKWKQKVFNHLLVRFRCLMVFLRQFCNCKFQNRVTVPLPMDYQSLYLVVYKLDWFVNDKYLKFTINYFRFSSREQTQFFH